MIKQLSLFLPGAIALVLSATPILPVFSQSTPPPTAPQVQKNRNKLNLTDNQKAQLKQIRESTRAQIEAVLTDEQKAKLQSLKQQRQATRQQRQAARQAGQTTRQPGQRGQRGKGMWAELNLTEDQKAKISAIRQESKQQTDAILTPEQRQQRQQQRQQWQQRRQQTQPST